MVQTSPCSELHPYPQQAASTPTFIIPFSRDLGPGLPSLGVWGQTTLLHVPWTWGLITTHTTNLSDPPAPGWDLLTPGPSPFAAPDLLPSHPWTFSLLTPGPAPFSAPDLLPSHPWTCSLLSPGPSPFSAPDLLPSQPWTCSPWRLGPPLREDVTWPGPLVPGVWGTFRGPPPRTSYFSAWGASSPPAPLYLHPHSPPLAPTGFSLPGGGPECCDGYSYLLQSPGQSLHCHHYGLFLIQCLILTQGCTLCILND